jgi:hypothetical protein
MKKEHTQQTEISEGHVATMQRDHDHTEAQER